MENNLAQSQINTSGRSKSKAGGRLLVASVHLYSGTPSRRRSWFALLSTTLLFPDEKIQTNQHKQQHDRERYIYMEPLSRSVFLSFSLFLFLTVSLITFSKKSSPSHHFLTVSLITFSKKSPLLIRGSGQFLISERIKVKGLTKEGADNLWRRWHQTILMLKILTPRKRSLTSHGLKSTTSRCLRWDNWDSWDNWDILSTKNHYFVDYFFVS